MVLRILIALLLLVFVSCNREDLKKKEEELAKREQELKDKELKQIDEKKEELKKKEEELNLKEQSISYEQKYKANSPPDDVPSKLIEYIDKYTTNGDPRVLKRAYNLWNDPINKIGSFEKFMSGFSSTLDDKITSTETVSNDGYNADVIVVHVAREINNNSSNYYNRYQVSKYESRYKLISINGQWKINSGKATLLNREYY